MSSNYFVIGSRTQMPSDVPDEIQKLLPSDFVIAFGIPTCKEEFWDAKDNPRGRDFVHNQVWQAYNVQFVSYLRNIEPYLVRLGAKVFHKVTLSDYGRLLQDPSNKVVILFSHWKDDMVEFFDGMATVDEIMQVVPRGFAGIVDLTVCHPERLVLRLRKRLPPTSLIKYANIENTPTAWLYFYWAVLTILKDSNNSQSGNPGISYLEALDKALEEFRKAENIHE